MANTYGSVTLSVTNFNSMNRPIVLTEQQVIPDPTDIDAINTFIQGSNTARSTFDIEGFCNISDLTSLIAYKNGYSTNTLVIQLNGTNVVSVSAKITKLDYNLQLGVKTRLFYTMSLIEV